VPEEVEIETEDETLQEAIELEGISLLKATALTTAPLATLAALASLKAGATMNEAFGFVLRVSFSRK
jgi:hypothetical protein